MGVTAQLTANQRAGAIIGSLLANGTLECHIRYSHGDIRA